MLDLDFRLHQFLFPVRFRLCGFLGFHLRGFLGFRLCGFCSCKSINRSAPSLQDYQKLSKLQMKMMMAGSLIVSFKGIFKNPFLLLEPASRIRPLHSDSASNHYPRSMFEKITKLEDALKLFDEMTQRQPLPCVVKFNQLLQAVTKMKHYSCSIDLFKQMTAIGAPVDVYTTNIVVKCSC